MNLISLLQQKLCQIRSILSCNSCNQCNFCHRFILNFLLSLIFFTYIAFYYFSFLLYFTHLYKNEQDISCTIFALYWFFRHQLTLCQRCCHCLRYSFGLIPSAFLNILLKYPAPSIPTAHPTSSIVICVKRSSCFALVIRFEIR